MKDHPEQPKTIVITGCTSGIGRALAGLLMVGGHHLILLCRTGPKADRLNSELNGSTRGGSFELIGVDLAEQEQIESALTLIGKSHRSIDVLVNNAGVYHRNRRTNSRGIEIQFAVHHLAPFILTKGLIPLLEKSGSGRIVNINSGLHFKGRIDLNDLNLERGYTGEKAYANAKLANLLTSYEFAERLSEKRITVNCLHPGVVATEMAREYPAPLLALVKLVMISPKRAAVEIAELLLDPKYVSITGKYFNRTNIARSSDLSYDNDLRRKLFALSENIVEGCKNRDNTV